MNPKKGQILSRSLSSGFLSHEYVNLDGRRHYDIIEAMSDAIAIIDFGSQYTQLIARRVREQQVYCEIFPPTVARNEIDQLAPRGIILSGGPASVYDEGAPGLPSFLLEEALPILGICYGMQLLARELGGRVEKSLRREFGPAQLSISEPSLIFGDLPPNLAVWMSHGDTVLDLPPGFRRLASSPSCAYAAIADSARGIFGLQFHPEVAHTPHGKQILRHFLFDICKCRPDWTTGAFIETQIREIRTRVGNGRVLCALSGGVDSLVTATLINRAIGDRLTCVFIDHGLLRANEAREVMNLAPGLNLDVRAVDARQEFLEKLKGVIDPEQKRRHIGAAFIRMFDEVARGLGTFEFLAQGTLYPDVIESAHVGTATNIKTHHNVGGLPTILPFKLIEPLRVLFKDEVRAVGRELGLPEKVIQRQPFPGPGLAVRIIGEVTEDRLKVLRVADAIVREEIQSANLDFEVWQYFCVLTPIQTVGVMGDGRTYENMLAVRAVTSEDGMTADWARLPHDLLARLSARIVNKVRGINRVVYDITSKPPGTIEWE
jgi:GMP synthase (glutamine-hydrolysing)